MSGASNSPKAFIAWMILGAIGGLSILVAISYFLIIYLRRRNNIQNKAYTEALELEQRPRGNLSTAREEVERREQERENRWQKLISRFGNARTTVDDIEAQARPVQVKPAPPNPSMPLPAQLRPAKKLPRPNSQSIWPRQEQADIVAQRAFQHVEYPFREEPRTQLRSIQNVKAPSTKKKPVWPSSNGHNFQNVAQPPNDASLPMDAQPKPIEALPPVSPERQARLSAQRARIFQHQDSPGRFSRQPPASNAQRTISVGTIALRKADKGRGIIS